MCSDLQKYCCVVTATKHNTYTHNMTLKYNLVLLLFSNWKCVRLAQPGSQLIRLSSSSYLKTEGEPTSRMSVVFKTTRWRINSKETIFTQCVAPSPDTLKLQSRYCTLHSSIKKHSWEIITHNQSTILLQKLMSEPEMSHRFYTRYVNCISSN
jgi:hypothetical protein